jgi:hypothetical protein
MSLDTQAPRQFLSEYQQIRYAEGRGSDNPACYRALPYTDPSARYTAKSRCGDRPIATSRVGFSRPSSARLQQTTVILDLGEVNAEMSYRLALRNHRPVAGDFLGGHERRAGRGTQ